MTTFVKQFGILSKVETMHALWTQQFPNTSRCLLHKSQTCLLHVYTRTFVATFLVIAKPGSNPVSSNGKQDVGTVYIHQLNVI